MCDGAAQAVSREQAAPQAATRPQRVSAELEGEEVRCGARAARAELLHEGGHHGEPQCAHSSTPPSASRHLQLPLPSQDLRQGIQPRDLLM